MAENTETTNPTTAVEETPVAEAEAKPVDSTETVVPEESKEPTDKTAEETTESTEKKEETAQANGDGVSTTNGATEDSDKEAVKRKADEPETDATQEKIQKLKEVAAETVEKAMPSEPANEAEATKPEEVTAE